MKLVTFTRDMRPYHANHDYALPDKVADAMIEAGNAKPAAAGNAGLRPDDDVVAQAIKSGMDRNRYMTRTRGR